MAGDGSSGSANLEPAEPGKSRAVTHGAHSERLIGPVAVDVAEEVEQLCAGTPAGEAQFAAARAVLAPDLNRSSIRPCMDNECRNTCSEWARERRA